MATDNKEYSKNAKAIAMREYRARLKEGKVRGPVNFTKDSVICVQTQIKEKIILDMRETLEELNEEYNKDFTTSQLLSSVLDTALQALKMKEKILDNGQKIVLPENVTKVPALLLLNEGYTVLYGEQILQKLKPRQEVEVRQATQNNMEPMAFSLGGGGGFGDVVSDQYSFLDQNAEEMSAKEGNGGMRQMHNYVDINTAFSGQIQNHNVNNNEFNTTIRGSSKRSEDSANAEMEARMKQMKEERDADVKRFSANRPPVGY